ncbi:MAG: BT_3928 family protein [Prevotella sp.]
MLKKAAVNVSRFIIALTFIFSGFAKAVDPIGTQYKIRDYLDAWGMDMWSADWLTLTASLAISTTEFFIGIMFFFAIRRRLMSRVTLLLMIAMTLLTVWIFIADPVSDCGCFGDAIKLTNGETLAKNIILLAAAITVGCWPLEMMRLLSRSNQWIVINYTAVFILGVSGYSLYYLPQFDFRPYHVGADIRKGMEIPEGAEQPVFETTFILEKDGIRKEFTLEDYPDSTWTFVDSRTVQTKTGFVPTIHDFAISTIDEGNKEAETEDITEDIVGDEGYTLLLIAPHLEQADDIHFDELNRLNDYAIEHGYRFICLTASTKKAINRWRDRTGAEYQFANTDETTLKTMIRSNPGLILLHDGTIEGKWSHNALPDVTPQTPPIEQGGLSTGTTSDTNTAVAMILWFVVPLTLLTIADRLWAWTRWVRRRNEE